MGYFRLLDHNISFKWPQPLIWDWTFEIKNCVTYYYTKSKSLNWKSFIIAYARDYFLCFHIIELWLETYKIILKLSKWYFIHQNSPWMWFSFVKLFFKIPNTQTKFFFFIKLKIKYKSQVMPEPHKNIKTNKTLPNQQGGSGNNQDICNLIKRQKDKMKHPKTQTYLGLLLITPFLDRVWMCSLLVMPPEPFPLGLLCFLDFLPGFVNLPISKGVSKLISIRRKNLNVFRF